jgi:hypothetical protein
MKNAIVHMGSIMLAQLGRPMARSVHSACTARGHGQHARCGAELIGEPAAQNLHLHVEDEVGGQ